MLISFALTVNSLIAGEKTVTRRRWDDEYARKFRAGMIVDAYDKLPYAGGKRIGKVRLAHDPYKQLLGDMTDEHFEREGVKHLWRDRREFINAMGGDDCELWVIEFDVVEMDKIENPQLAFSI